MQNIELLTCEEVRSIINWLSLPKVDDPFDLKTSCQSRDIFQARLDNLFAEFKNPLLTAIVGEIGNNSFDHNMGNWADIIGIHFKYAKNTIIIADRGQGVKKSLSKIIPDIKNDVEAVKIAFTKIISGRSPEQRGNGLKFVSSVVAKHKWELFFQSGNGCVYFSQGSGDYFESKIETKGCLAVIKFE